MKRLFILLAVSLSLMGRRATAQEVAPSNGPPVASTAASIAAQQAADERYKRMAADIEALQTDNDSLKGKIASLEQKIEELRQQLSANANNTSIQDDLKRLAESIAQVDKKREEDKAAISEEIRKSIGGLEKSLAGVPPTTHAPPPRLAPDTGAAPIENGFAYTIRDGDNLTAILKAYNADFKSKGLKTISLRQAMEANPNVKWDRLLVGQKIVIPKPEGQ